jgi:hypothetical protein
MNLTNLLILLLAAGVGTVIYILTRPKNDSFDATKLIEESAKLKAELSQKDQKLGEITTQMKQEKSAKDELIGKNKIMYAEGERFKNDNRALQQDKEKLSAELARFQEEEARKTKEFELKIAELAESRKTLEDEKIRIRKEDVERAEQEIAERDRMWAEHEEVVKLRLFELTKEPDCYFNCFDNKNLPEGFSGKFKPDFMVEFLDQYVIFDAKVSRSENLQNYLNNNVKSTVEKINGDPKIYPMVFFVVPSEAITTLSKTKYLEKGFNFFVITVEAIPVILASFKKISSYELAEQMDPLERENIVNLIAEFDYHINMRNALDLLAAKHGIGVLEKANVLKADVREQVGLQKNKIRFQQSSPIEMKNLIMSQEKQRDLVQDLTEPKVAISRKDLDLVQPLIDESINS